VEPSGDGKAGASLFAESCVQLIEVVIDHGSQQWRLTVGHSHEDSSTL
jgi:hypothetical protein